MSGRGDKRRKKKRQQRLGSRPVQFVDPHVDYLLESIPEFARLFSAVAAAPDPAATLDQMFESIVSKLRSEAVGFNPYRLIEVARMAMLPWGPAGQVTVSPESTAAHVELICLLALADRPESELGSPEDRPEPQAMSRFVSDSRQALDELIKVSHLREMVGADASDKLFRLASQLRASQVSVRSTSYPDMSKAVILQLMAGCSDIESIVSALFKFSVHDAFDVLGAIHELQEEKMNMRAQNFGDFMSQPISADSTKGAAISAFFNLFEPQIADLMVSVDEIVGKTGVAPSVAQSVVDRFALSVGDREHEEVITEFLAGSNPLRTNPVVVEPKSGLVMLLHPAGIADAVKENMELTLKSSPSWEKYQNRRGSVLENRVAQAISSLLPEAIRRDAFQYYVADNEEQSRDDASSYTKRVEGDHLFLIDDVAIIVEDKATALSALSRGGKTSRLQSDLRNIVSRATDQANRLRRCIEVDGGVRIEGEGWLDLTHIRETHLITVSLDDLTNISTATAELVESGMLPADAISWTVSINDLELISQLEPSPFQFLLYLRRRRNPHATRTYFAPDELDLYLYFLSTGLWVEPDPEEIRRTFPFLPPPTTAELRRHRQQRPGYVTSRTDALDQWFYSRGSTSEAPKPTMPTSPLIEVLDFLQQRSPFGWLSVGATLLSGSYAAQSKMAKYGEDLLRAPSLGKNGRSLSVPMITTHVREESWLLVWSTRPDSADSAAHERNLRDYLQAKKAQLNLSRGAALVYDQRSNMIADMYYDATKGDPPEHVRRRMSSLKPASHLDRLPPPNARASGKRSRGHR